MITYRNNLLFTVIITLMLTGCSGSGTTPSEVPASGGGGNDGGINSVSGYTSIALPNGSTVSYATDKVAVTQGGNTSTSFSIHGGTSGYEVSTPSLTVASGHINLLSKAGTIESGATLTPTPCDLVSGSESQVSCGVAIDASKLAVGTYTIEAPVINGSTTNMLYESLEVTSPSVTPVGPVAGIISITPKTSTLLFNQKQAYTLSLSNSQGLAGVSVSVTAAPGSLVTLSGNSCTLSTSSNTCTVVATAGTNIGQTYLTATAGGYTITPSAISVTGSALINGGNSLTNIYPVTGANQVVTVSNGGSQALTGVSFASTNRKVSITNTGITNACGTSIAANSSCNIKVNYVSGVANDTDTVTMTTPSLAHAVTAPVVLKTAIIISNEPRTAPGFYSQVTNGPSYSIFHLHNNDVDQAINISNLAITNVTDLVISPRVTLLPGVDNKYQTYLQCVTSNPVTNISTASVPAGGDCIIVLHANKMSSQPGLGTQNSSISLSVASGASKTFNIANTTSLYVGGMSTIGGLVAGVGTGFCGVNNTKPCMLAKYDGATWSSVANDADSMISFMTVDGADNIYIGGMFTTIGGLPAGVGAGCGPTDGAPCMLAKFDSINFTSLANDFDSPIAAISVDSMNNLYVGGNFSTVAKLPLGPLGVAQCGENADRPCMLAEYSNGTWSSIANNADNIISTIAIDRDNNVYTGGGFSTIGGLTAGTGVGYCGPGGGVPCMLAKYSNLGVWSIIANDADAGIGAVTFDKGNNLYVGGSFSTISGLSQGAGGGFCGGQGATHPCMLAKYNGGVWSSIASNANSWIGSIIFDSSNNLYVGGAFNSIGNLLQSSYSMLAKYSGVWGVMANNVKGYINTMSMDNSNNLYVGGQYSTIANLPEGNANTVCGFQTHSCMLAKNSNGVWSSLANDADGQSITAIATSMIITPQ